MHVIPTRTLAAAAGMIAFMMLTALGSAAGAQEQKPVQLFNGRDFTGWTAISQDPATKLEDVWSVRDGVIHCTGKPAGYLRTNEDYTNFVLRFQWRTQKKGNSGCLIRVQPPDKVWPRSVECQLATDQAGDIWIVEGFPIKVDESRRRGRNVKKLQPSSEKRIGEWNQYEITADGGNLTMKVNDVVQNTATEMEVIPGKILFQSEGAEIEFRNIELTPLAAAAAPRPAGAATTQATAQKLFNGTDLTGFSAYLKDAPDKKMEDVWTVKDGVIRCAGTPAGYLKTNQQFRDFALKFDWRWPEKPGNSGVLIRAHGPDQIWPKCLEPQLMHQNAGDIFVLGGFGVAQDRAKGSRIPKMQPTNEKPPGEWNTYEIRAQGDTIELKVNGLLQNTATGAEATAGYIGFQSEGAPIEFRNMEITDLGAAAAPRAAGPDAPEAKPALFNGRDLTGWTAWFKEGGKADDVWSVNEGILRYAGGKNGYLITKDDFDNFALKFKYRFPHKPGDSGVLLRVQGDNSIWPKSLEAQMKSGKAGDIWLLDGAFAVAGPERTSKVNLKMMRAASEKPVGEWNVYEITAQGGNCELKVNGVLQNQVTRWDTPTGKIALQAQDVPVEFKDFEFQPLPPASASGEPKRLSGLDGWHVTGNGNWTYADGVIEGKQGKQTASYTHVISDGRYRDFRATLKFKCLAGNSGFYFRAQPDAKGQMHGIQAEIDVARDAGGLYESYGRNWIFKPKADDVAKCFKPNDWNEMTVEARGTHLATHVNGTKVADIDDPAQRSEGHCALQIHGGQDVHVMFKEIRIEPLSQ